MSKRLDFYEILGIARDASNDQIRRAYLRIVRKQHPDVNVEEGATERFLVIQEAYEVLSNPKLRSDYDSTLPANEEPDAGVKLEVFYSRPIIPGISEPQITYLLLKLTAPPDSKTRPNPPLNLCLVLDRSTSMRGERMDTVKSTAIELLRQLKPKDIFSIVTFSDRAEVLVSPGMLQEHSVIESRIQMIQPDGGTEILHGLETGLFEVRSKFSKDFINHMVLITDGRTYGDEEACLELASQAAEMGIGISGLGIGGEWNDTFIDRLTATTGGSSAYISQASDIRHFLKQRISGLGQVFGERVVLHLEPATGSELRYAFRISPDPIPLKNQPPIHLGILPKDTSLEVVLELLLPVLDKDITDYKLGEGKITFEVPIQSRPSYTLTLNLSRSIGSTESRQPPPAQILQAISNLTLYRIQERANKHLANGQTEKASRLLQNLATQLFSQGEGDLAHTILDELNHIHQKNNLSDEGKKRIKYGTRALLLPPSINYKPSSVLNNKRTT